MSYYATQSSTWIKQRKQWLISEIVRKLAKMELDEIEKVNDYTEELKLNVLRTKRKNKRRALSRL